MTSHDASCKNLSHVIVQLALPRQDLHSKEMVWVLDNYQPILTHGYEKWLEMKGKERLERVDKTVRHLQQAHNKLVVKGKVIPPLPADLNKVYPILSEFDYTYCNT